MVLTMATCIGKAMFQATQLAWPAANGQAARKGARAVQREEKREAILSRLQCLAAAEDKHCCGEGGASLVDGRLGQRPGQKRGVGQSGRAGGAMEVNAWRAFWPVQLLARCNQIPGWHE